ncbi:hypothetical protein AGDE_16302 [Angomonas deanei]|uniref:Uncharacterized protein n=1 Tax=Angomonas deanei TaxID=59799 RepID=A0A7G2CU22_9TRYP|nr:hypothetical protein AGDE_16302 [Angomonas deanei]CAD2222779.1 hypothetical protein, conserved [Angomonas deanei]|eukprot:EPY17356.1 hypothetical protein AGDE_16302 [Angomonas deanei]
MIALEGMSVYQVMRRIQQCSPCLVYVESAEEFLSLLMTNALKLAQEVDDKEEGKERVIKEITTAVMEASQAWQYYSHHVLESSEVLWLLPSRAHDTRRWWNLFLQTMKIG